jgi:protein-disulfide isomerase
MPSKPVRRRPIAARLRFPLIVAFLVALAAPGAAQPVPSLPEAAVGRDDAPVTVVEYSSLGCSHCAAFHAEVLPQLKTRYVDTGKVRWVARDFPLGQLQLAGAVAARCAGPQGYLSLMEVLFRTQERWMTSADPIGELEKMMRQTGVGKARFDACLQDRALIEGIMAHAQEVQKSKLVTATPTFVVNGERIVGMTAVEDFAAIIDRHLKSAPPHKPQP